MSTPAKKRRVILTPPTPKGVGGRKPPDPKKFAQQLRKAEADFERCESKLARATTKWMKARKRVRALRKQWTKLSHEAP